jgi:hypothetical protein
VARNAFALALLTAMALGGCSTIKGVLHGDKEEKAAQAKLVALRARTDSLRRARRMADSLAVVRHAACVDSVRADLSKPLSKKARGAKRKKAASPELIATKAQQICEQMEGAPQGSLAANQSAQAAAPSDSSKQQPNAGMSSAAKTPVPAPAAAATPVAAEPVPQPTPAQPAPPSALTPVLDSAMANATAQDSAQKARDLEMSRETFAYSGAVRDPFNSLLNMAKNGPELADLQLVGIYHNLRSPGASVAVFREKDGGKRHKLRAGDQVGRSRLVQIRERDVVFTVEDFGFERQETLSLRKQEDVTP